MWVGSRGLVRPLLPTTVPRKSGRFISGVNMTERIALWVADGLIRAGRWLAARYAAPPMSKSDLWIRSERWRMALGAFLWWAAPLNFSRSKVLRAGICSRPAYDTFMRLLRAMGVVETFPKSGTVFGVGWDKRKASVLLHRRLINPPFPLDVDPPHVLHTRALQSQLTQPSQSAQLGVTWAEDGGRVPQLKGRKP